MSAVYVVVVVRNFILTYSSFMPTLERQVDQILSIVLDIQTHVGKLEERISRLEEAHEKVFNKLDEFLTLIHRHESEIAALRNAYDRLNERVER